MLKRQDAMLVSVLFALLACGSADHSAAPNTAPAASDHDALAAVLFQAGQSCAPAKFLPASAASERDQSFTELVLLEVPIAAAKIEATSLERLAKLPGVRLLGSPHLTGEYGARATFQLEQHFGLLAEPALHRVSISLEHVDAGASALDIEVELANPNANSTQSPQFATVRFSATATPDHARVASAPWPGDPQRALLAVIKIFPVHDSDDLRAIFECKMRLRQSASARF